MRTALLLAITAAACSSKPAPLTVACPGADASATAGPHPGTMQVSGTATLEIVPDTADMHITLSSELPRPRQAAAAVRAKQQALTRSLAALGLGSDDVSLTPSRLDPRFVLSVALLALMAEARREDSR